jgi:hypothetical protein
VKIEHVELQVGKNYKFKMASGSMAFVAETGGIISGDNINGSVQAGKVIFTANGEEFEGHFIS